MSVIAPVCDNHQSFHLSIFLAIYTPATGSNPGVTEPAQGYVHGCPHVRGPAAGFRAIPHLEFTSGNRCQVR